MLLNLVSKTWKIVPRQVRTFVTRRLQPKFTVSVTGILTNDRGEVLLLDHLLRPRSGWAPPGGFVERGEQPQAALRREIKEETTLDIADIKIIRARTLKRHVEIIYIAHAIGEARPASREVKSLRWTSIDEMPADMSLELRSAISNALAGSEL